MNIPNFQLQQMPIQNPYYNMPVEQIDGIGAIGKQRLLNGHGIATAGQLNNHLRKVQLQGGCTNCRIAWMNGALGYFCSNTRATAALNKLRSCL